jgi:heme exporter protein B
VISRDGRGGGAPVRPGLLRTALLVAGKDLRTEARTGEVVVTTGVFAVLVAVLASVSFYLDAQRARELAPGVLWISMSFAGILAMGRTWAREREQDAYRALMLSPVPRAGLWLGKAFGSVVFLVLVELVLVPLVALLFHLDAWPVRGRLALLLLLGTVGFVAAGTTFAAMTVRTRARELVLSIVLFPLTSPALLAGVVATREVLLGGNVEETLAWSRILLAFDVVFVAGGLALAEPLLED